MQEKVIIFGEFPPNTHTGISICNQMVSEVLSNANYSVHKIEEYSWSKRNFNKIIHLIGIYLKVLKILLKNKTSVLYFNLPLSATAMLKIAPIIGFFRLFSRNWLTRDKPEEKPSKSRCPTCVS